MRKESGEVRKKMVVMRLNEGEYNRLQSLFKKTTCRQLSEYLRKVALEKPVVVKYRNQSADEFLTDMIGLKKELNAIGNNFNQAVHKLHILEKIPEFRSWITVWDNTRQLLLHKTEIIEEKMTKIYKQWLHE